MLGIAAFVVSVVSVIMSFFEGFRLPAFAIGILAIIISVISAYGKDKKEMKDGAAKDSRTLELGALIISGATAVSYFVFMFIS